MMKRTSLILLAGALLIGLTARIPGILWGYNFPTGWSAHHIDEYSHWVNAEHLIDPTSPLRWYHPYPKGTAAQTAIPWLAWRVVRGQLTAQAPGIIEIIVTGRVISVLYGAATILVVFLIARRLFRDIRVALFAAWVMALAGLHVSQSHFFLADVPGLFWFLLGSYFLMIEIEEPELNYSPYLMAAALSYGIAFGIKLVLIGMPTLGIIVLWRQPRLLRALYASVFFVAGFVLINLSSFNHYDLLKAFSQGTSDPYLWNWWDNILLYIVELPSLISFPVLILAFGSAIPLWRKFAKLERSTRFWSIALVVLLPQLIQAYFVVFQLDHFPRHMIPFIPWLTIYTGWSLVTASDWLHTRRLSPVLLYLPVIIYLAVFVFDGERVFIQEPRNEAARWLMQNLPVNGSYSWRGHGDIPGYEHIYYPNDGRPDMIVIEMHHANHYLSGMGMKNSFPADHRYIFEGRSQEYVTALQGLFMGTTEYTEAIRFRESYFMPEYNLVINLIGDRSRNYVTEVVIFTHPRLELTQGDSKVTN